MVRNDENTPTGGAKGIRRIVNATFNSVQGFKAAYDHEEAFRQECYLAVVLIPLGFWLGETGIEKALLIGVILLVFIAELLNTGIEVTVDRIGIEKHELSGRAKDMGSTAVLISLINVVVVWVLVLLF